MALQEIFNIVFGLLIGLFGWLGREVWMAVAKLREDIKRIEIMLPSKYVEKNEFRDSVQELKELLTKISDKLDAKADKT